MIVSDAEFKFEHPIELEEFLKRAKKRGLKIQDDSEGEGEIMIWVYGGTVPFGLYAEDSVDPTFIVKVTGMSSADGGNQYDAADVKAHLDGVAAMEEFLKSEDIAYQLQDQTEDEMEESASPEKIVERLLEDEQPSLEKRLVDALNQTGVRASYEHPGYANIGTPSGNVAVGTLDGFWGISMEQDGYLIDIPSDALSGFAKFYEVDPETVPLEQVVAAVKQVLDWEKGGE